MNRSMLTHGADRIVALIAHNESTNCEVSQRSNSAGHRLQPTTYDRQSALFFSCFFVPFRGQQIRCALRERGQAAPAAKKPTGPARFETEIAAFEKWDHQNAVPQNCILFVGSSTIRLWQTADAFPDLPVINRGFGGSTIPDVNHFADRIVFKYKPRTIVFYSGDNDIAAGRSPDKVFADFETFAKSVHERLPNTQLIYLAIKPSPLRWENVVEVANRQRPHQRPDQEKRP